MRRALAIAAVLSLGSCARRMPPRATALDAQRANVTVAELDEGRSLVVSKCGSRCHQPPMPSDHSVAEWPKAMDEMAPRAGVTFTQRQAIERYLMTMTSKR